MLLNPKDAKIDQENKVSKACNIYLLHFANCPPHWTCSFELLCKDLPLQWWQQSDRSAWFARSDQLNNCIQKKSMLFISIVLVLTSIIFFPNEPEGKSKRTILNMTTRFKYFFVNLIILPYHWVGVFLKLFFLPWHLQLKAKQLKLHGRDWY